MEGDIPLDGSPFVSLKGLAGNCTAFPRKDTYSAECVFIDNNKYVHQDYYGSCVFFCGTGKNAFAFNYPGRIAINGKKIDNRAFLKQRCSLHLTADCNYFVANGVKTTATPTTGADFNSIYGRRLINDRMRPNFSLGALRIYDRELTDKEVLNNWELDKRRFKIEV